MSIISMDFLWFCVILFALYYTIFRKKQWILLLAGSVLFYILSSGKYFLLVVSSILVTYIATGKMGEIYANNQDAKMAKKQNKKIFQTALAVELLLLGIMKYYNFFGYNVNAVFSFLGLDVALPKAGWLLPLGISFYTFALVGYTLDVYWKRVEPEKNIAKLALFTLYFPHILQGPIARYGKLSPQFYEEKKFDYERTRDGILLIFYGLLKKVALANRLSVMVSPYFDQYELYGGLDYLPALLLYSVEIYADFSGAMDILGGVSQILGITLEKNFLRPYFAKTIPEFWQRWHVSLGSWFKDYVLFPVSISSKAKKFNKWTKKKFGVENSRIFSNIMPVCSVWLLTGIWHGAAWKFIIWGMFHCTLILGGTLLGKQIQWFVKKTGMRTECFSFRLFQMTRTFLLCTLGRVFFRAGSAGAAVGILVRMCTQKGGNLPAGYTLWEMVIALGLILVVFTVSLVEEMTGESVRAVLSRQNLVFRWLVYYGLIFAVIIFGIYGVGQNAGVFLYQQF